MYKVLLLLAVLVCPITMGTMMFNMMRGKNKKDGGDTTNSDKPN